MSDSRQFETGPRVRHSVSAPLLGGVSASAAQGLPAGASSLSETHGDWTVVCVMPDSNVRCAISQRQVNKRTTPHRSRVPLTPDHTDARARSSLTASSMIAPATISGMATISPMRWLSDHAVSRPTSNGAIKAVDCRIRA